MILTYLSCTVLLLLGGCIDKVSQLDYSGDQTCPILIFLRLAFRDSSVLSPQRVWVAREKRLSRSEIE